MTASMPLGEQPPKRPEAAIDPALDSLRAILLADDRLDRDALRRWLEELEGRLADSDEVAALVAPALAEAARRKIRQDQEDLVQALYPIMGRLVSRSVAEAAEPGFLQLSVQDNGVGISDEDQQKLFERFFRAGTAALTGASGTGLGLHITRSLVELHGGRIWFESQEGQGSTFYMTLPVFESE